MNQSDLIPTPGSESTESHALAAGFTSRLIADCAMYTLELLAKPDAELDSTFVAYDRNEKTWLNVKGWRFDISPE